jgi:hypothetical protein
MVARCTIPDVKMGRLMGIGVGLLRAVSDFTCLTMAGDADSRGNAFWRRIFLVAFVTGQAEVFMSIPQEGRGP